VSRIKFGTDGWRAAIAEEYTFHNVRRCARGVAEYLQQAGAADRGVVVCHDRRFASEHFARACIEVLAAHDIRSYTPQEAVPTQVGSYFTREMNAGAGIVITASHNPWTDNGFKVKADTGGAAAPEMLGAIEATMDTHSEDELPPRRDYDEAVAAGLVESFDPYPKFRDQLASIVDLERIRAADRRVLVENLYGSGAGWYTRLIGGGRLTVRELHTERNPFFGGVNPEPIRPNVDAWLEEIPRWGADIGIAFDGDADRIGVVDQEGTIIWGDRILILYAQDVLARTGRGQPIIFDVKCSQALPDAIEKAGGRPIMWKTGHSLIKDKMKELKAPVAGEMSGHMFFAEGFYGHDDALYGAARLLRVAADSGRSVRELLADVPDFVSTPEIRIDVPEEQKFDIVRRAVQHFRRLHDVIDVDGVRVLFGDGWGLIRASNTQPVLVARFEALTPARLGEIRGEMEGWLRSQGVKV